MYWGEQSQGGSAWFDCRAFRNVQACNARPTPASCMMYMCLCRIGSDLAYRASPSIDNVKLGP